MSDAAGQVWDGWNVTSWSPETAWSKVVIPGIAAGETIESLLPAAGGARERGHCQWVHGEVI